MEQKTIMIKCKLWEYISENKNLIEDNVIFNFIPRANNYIAIKDVGYKVISSLFFNKDRNNLLLQVSEHILMTMEDYQNGSSTRHFLLQCFIEKPKKIDFIIEQNEKENLSITLCEIPSSKFDYITIDEKLVCKVSRVRQLPETSTLYIWTDGCFDKLDRFRAQPIHFVFSLTKR